MTSSFSALDRRRFRELVVALGAASLGACAARGGELQSGEVHIPPQPVQPRREVAPPPPPVPLAAPTAEGDLGDPTAEGGDDDEVDRSTCGEIVTNTVRRAGPVCNDAVSGALPACIACSGFAFPGDHCATYKKFLKPKVAEAAVACLRALSPKNRCDACAVYACGDRAMKASCPDPTAVTECKALRARCPSMPQEECLRYVSALVPAGRARLRACMTSCSLYSCMESL
ncbi:MAG: hypothetical protein IPF92_06860 [Myxococcales bacterium]|jgi:hypothetical protein|nr:hypothetical protein [Myxococcales bacterium]MBL0192760.1 hypothetical protein [Myxococcales bacterium]HQY62521.1 hypothetical protein [Polyangiaceae bacterium]